MSWLRTIAAFAFALAFVCQPAAASAFVAASPQARVGGFEVVASMLAGGLGDASRGQHQGIGAAYDENASGYRFAAGGVGLPEGATRAASRYPKQLQQALRMTPQQLEKSIGSFSGRISQHQGFLRNPQSHVPNWSQLTPQHQQNLIHHWTNDISRHEAYRDIAEAVLRGAL